jgi:hypothetical protein
MTPETVFFNDHDATTAANAVGQLGYQSYASMRQPLTETAWKTVPNTYIVCEDETQFPCSRRRCWPNAPTTSTD